MCKMCKGLNPWYDWVYRTHFILCTHFQKCVTMPKDEKKLKTM